MVFNRREGRMTWNEKQARLLFKKKKKPPWIPNSIGLKLCFSIQVNRKGALEYTVRWDKHQTSDVFLSFNLWLIFFYQHANKFQALGGNFQPSPRAPCVYVFTLVFSLGGKVYEALHAFVYIVDQ